MEEKKLNKDINVRSKTEDKRKKILANRVYSDETLKKWKKEDLIEQIRILEHNWSCAEESYNNSVKNSEKIFAEQKAGIERLNGCIVKYAETLGNEQQKSAQLQKQVDELKERNYWLESEHEYQCEKSYFEGVEKGKEQTVKDTAKEIWNGRLTKYARKL